MLTKLEIKIKRKIRVLLFEAIKKNNPGLYQQYRGVHEVDALVVDTWVQVKTPTLEAIDAFKAAKSDVLGMFGTEAPIFLKDLTAEQFFQTYGVPL